MRIYVLISLVVFSIFAYEYSVLNNLVQSPSILRTLQTKGLVSPKLNLSPEPGKPISYALGWLGLSVLGLTNIYVIRKRFPMFHKFGRLKQMLDFHIFCGILGPIFILFHTNFKVGGIVAISFWCMVVSFSSGAIGKYAYMQLLQTRGALADRINKMDQGFTTLSKQQLIAPDHLLALQRSIFQYYGFADPKRSLTSLAVVSIPRAFALSILGEFGFFMANQASEKMKVPKKLLPHFKQYAKVVRQLSFLEPFRRFMGYWHSFHLPFAVFMYLVAAIHVTTALLFQVR